MMKKIFKDKNGEVRVGFGVLYSYLVMIITMLLVFIPTQLIFGAETEIGTRVGQIMMGTVGSAIIITMTRFFLKKAVKSENTKNYDLTIKTGLNKNILGAVVGLVFVVLMTTILFIFGELEITYQGIPVFTFIAGTCTFLGMAILEESMFRGIIESVFSKFGIIVSIAISALLFTSTHTDFLMDMNIWRFIELLTMGICFSIAARAMKSVSFAVGFHWAINIGMAVIFGYGGATSIFLTTYKNGYNLLVGLTESGGSLISIILSIVFAIGFYIYGKKRNYKIIKKANSK